MRTNAKLAIGLVSVCGLLLGCENNDYNRDNRQGMYDGRDGYNRDTSTYNRGDSLNRGGYTTRTTGTSAYIQHQNTGYPGGRFGQENVNWRERREQRDWDQNRSQFNDSGYNRNQYDRNDWNQNQSQYGNTGQYERDQYNRDTRDQYTRDQYNRGQYDRNRFDQGQYDQDRYNQNQYNQNRGQSNRNWWDQNQSQYNPGQYDQNRSSQNNWNQNTWDQTRWEQQNSWNRDGMNSSRSQFGEGSTANPGVNSWDNTDRTWNRSETRYTPGNSASSTRDRGDSTGSTREGTQRQRGEWNGQSNDARLDNGQQNDWNDQAANQGRYPTAYPVDAFRDSWETSNTGVSVSDDQIPGQVYDTLDRYSDGGMVRNAVRANWRGRTVYEIPTRVNGEMFKLWIDQNGRLLSMRQTDNH